MFGRIGQFRLVHHLRVHLYVQVESTQNQGQGAFTPASFSPVEMSSRSFGQV